MTSSARRRQGEIQRAIFEVLLEQPDGLPVTEVLSRAEAICPATDFENQDYASQPGVRRYPKRQRFSTITSVKAGWLIKDSGIWRLTDDGRAAYVEYPDADNFEVEARSRYQEWVAAQPAQFYAPEDAEDAEAARLESVGVGQRRAWLVRGANVSGVNVVSQWLTEGFCSIAWSHLPNIEPGASRAEIAAAVRAHEPDASPQSRGSSVGNLHRFLSEIEVGDVVITVSDDDVYVGEIAGEPTYRDHPQVPRQRAVAWANAAQPFSRRELSQAAADGLRGQQTVSSLAPHVAEFATLGGVSDIVVLPTPDVALSEPGQDLSDRLLLPLEWLSETIDLLNDKRQIMLYGPPGTGKTYVAQELCKSLVQAAGGEYEVVQFHPSYAYEDFFEGLRPRLNDDGSGGIGFSLVHGPLRRMAARATEDPLSPYVLIIDEINRANLAKVFGELYFLLEYRSVSVALQYSEEPFALPRNLFIIGTMNTADRSIALVDAAMRRRFYFQKLFPTEAPVKELLAAWLARENLPAEPGALLVALNDAIGDPDFAIGPSYLMTKRVADDAGLERIWRTAILPLLEEHFFGEGRDIDAEFGLASLRKALEPVPQT